MLRKTFKRTKNLLNDNKTDLLFSKIYEFRIKYPQIEK